MPGLKDFTKQTFHPRVIVTKTAAYSVTLADEWVRINGSSTANGTMTLPILSTMQGTTTHKKVLKFTNVHATATAAVVPGTGDTIGGRTAIYLKPGESIVISGNEAGTDWTIADPFPLAPGIRNTVALIAETSGTAAVNVIDSGGSPVIGTIVSIVACALDNTAGNIIIKNATDTVSTIAKGTTAGVVTSATALTTPALAVGDLLTVESSATDGNARVIIHVSTQTLTNNG